MLIRLIRKSKKAIFEHGPVEFFRRLFVFIDRLIRPQKYFHVLKSQDKKKFLLFITGEPRNSTSFYRCEVPKEQLALQGKDADIVYYKYLKPEMVENYEHVIWYRLPLLQEILPAVAKMKAQARKIIYDIDDLLFAVESIKAQKWFAGLDVADQEVLIKKAQGIQEFMSHADLGISSTDSLKDEMRKYIKGEIHLYKNSFSQAQKNIAEEIGDNFPGVRNIGFFSGSNTHDENFALVEGALVDLLQEYPDLKLYVGGELTLPPSMNDFASQIVKIPLKNPDEFIRIVAKCSIVLYPLVKTRHNECKSELRIIQSGILKRVCIATNTSPNQGIIHHGENGLLIDDDSKWYEEIKSCLEDEVKTRDLGKNIYKDIHESYNPKLLSEGLIKFLQNHDK